MTGNDVGSGFVESAQLPTDIRGQLIGFDFVRDWRARLAVALVTVATVRPRLTGPAPIRTAGAGRLSTGFSAIRAGVTTRPWRSPIIAAASVTCAVTSPVSRPVVYHWCLSPRILLPRIRAHWIGSQFGIHRSNTRANKK